MVGVGVVMMVEPSEHVIEGTIFQHENDEVIELSGHAFLLCTHAFCSEPIFGDAEKSTPSEEDRQPGKKMISLLIYPFKFSLTGWIAINEMSKSSGRGEACVY